MQFMDRKPCLRTIKALRTIRTVLTLQTEQTVKPLNSYKNHRAKQGVILSVDIDMQFTARKLCLTDCTNCKDRMINNRTITVRVYWTNLGYVLTKDVSFQLGEVTCLKGLQN